MTATPFSTVGYRSMADGTFRLTVDFEPRHARDAFGLFAMPGTPGAAAALKVGTQLPEGEPPADAPKGGALARWAALRCKDARFLEWLGCDSEAEAAAQIYNCCGVTTRSALDNDRQAARLFDEKFRELEVPL